MNRRDFTVNVAGAALGAVAFGRTSPIAAAAPGMATAEGEAPGVPFRLSVMLWTVFQRLPFEQRLEKVAEAGYKNVELVGEYKKWSENDFRRANAKRRELGITFDTTAGLAHGVGDPRARGLAGRSQERAPHHGEARMPVHHHHVGRRRLGHAAPGAAPELH